MASFAMFPTDFKTYEKRYRRFWLKRTSQKTFFLIPKFVKDTINQVIGPRVVQFREYIELVFSNRPRALRSFDFEITRAITP